jgi:hypothetical protein
MAFHNHHGTAEHWIKKDKAAARRTLPSCRSFEANPVRPQLHASLQPRNLPAEIGTATELSGGR